MALPLFVWVLLDVFLSPRRKARREKTGLTLSYLHEIAFKIKKIKEKSANECKYTQICMFVRLRRTTTQ
jgi:hypothetical protein